MEKSQRNLKQTDPVLVREDNILESHWLLAIIIKAHPRKHGIVRPEFHFYKTL